MDFLKSSTTIFNIPVYQRNYEWTTEQCQQLFDDIESIINNNYESSHFLGQLFMYLNGGEHRVNIYNILDGQQRITSFMLFLKAIADVIDDSRLEGDITEYYLKNPRLEEHNSIKLISIEKDRLVFRKVIENDLSKRLSKFMRMMFFPKIKFWLLIMHPNHFMMR